MIVIINSNFTIIIVYSGMSHCDNVISRQNVKIRFFNVTK